MPTIMHTDDQETRENLAFFLEELAEKILVGHVTIIECRMDRHVDLVPLQEFGSPAVRHMRGGPDRQEIVISFYESETI